MSVPASLFTRRMLVLGSLFGCSALAFVAVHAAQTAGGVLYAQIVTNASCTQTQSQAGCVSKCSPGMFGLPSSCICICPQPKDPPSSASSSSSSSTITSPVSCPAPYFCMETSSVQNCERTGGTLECVSGVDTSVACPDRVVRGCCRCVSNTHRACGLTKIMGRVDINVRWKPCTTPAGQTGRWFSSLDAICENGKRVSQINESGCKPESEMVGLLTAKCAQERCPYPMVCDETITLQPISVASWKPGECLGKYQIAYGECVSVSRPGWSASVRVDTIATEAGVCGITKEQATEKLIWACAVGERQKSCRPGTAADYLPGSGTSVPFSPVHFIRSYLNLTSSRCPMVTQKVTFMTNLTRARLSYDPAFDANGDGRVTVSDAIALHSAMLEVMQTCDATTPAKLP